MTEQFDLAAARRFAAGLMESSLPPSQGWLFRAGEGLAAACDEIARLNDVDARNDLFADCLHRALKIWQGDNPDAECWPDGAWTIAWILRNNEQLRADNARLEAAAMEANGAIKDALDVITDLPMTKQKLKLARAKLTAALEREP